MRPPPAPHADPGHTPERTPRCTHCPHPAVEHIRYAGVHLCRQHFLGFVERRVKREIRHQGGFPGGATIGVAVSGGKDSIVTLRLLHRVLGPRLHGPDNPHGDLTLRVLTVDEGIAGYRAHGLDVATRAAQELGLPHDVLSYRATIGATMDDVHRVKGEQNECSFCGVFRRATLNRLARDTGCDLLVTGHNLDDTAQAVLMNVTSGDIARLARLGPHLEPKDGLVPRRLPLRWIPEKEIFLTALLEGWEHDHHECPYAVNSQRALYRDVLARLEAATPGTRHALLRSLESLRPVLPGLDAARGSALTTCTVCGEPASAAVCKTCTLGETVRTRLAALAPASEGTTREPFSPTPGSPA